MKNWKDKAFGLFAGIGVMAIFMGFEQQWIKSEVKETDDGIGMYQFQAEHDPIGKRFNYFTMDTRNGEIYWWDFNNLKWKKRTNPMR